MRKLSEVPTGTQVEIVAVCGLANDRASRLAVMGLVPGVVVEVKRKAPLVDPIVVRLGASEICVRRREAELLLVKELSANETSSEVRRGCCAIG